jgi:hypothetical protein
MDDVPDFTAANTALEEGRYDDALAFVLAPDPLPRLAELNLNAAHLPLLPLGRQAPRLASDLSTYARETRERAQALRGLGRVSEADALCRTALAGLGTDEMRKLAQAELDEAGAIHRILGAHQQQHWGPPP